MSNYPKFKRISLASIAVAVLFLFTMPSLIASTYSSNSASAPPVATSTITNPVPGKAATVPASASSLNEPFTVVTELGWYDLQVIHGVEFAGEINVSSTTIGAAYDPENGFVYAGGYSCDCVPVVSPMNMSMVGTISIPGPGAAVVYSPKSGYIYVSTFSDPSYYVIINPNTGRVLTKLKSCGSYAEFGDVNLQTGAVYFATRFGPSGSYPFCVDELSGTKIIKTVTAQGIDDYGVGTSVNQKTGDVLVNGYLCGCVYVFSSALKYKTDIDAGPAYLWGSWSIQKTATVNLAEYEPWIMGIVSSKLRVTGISLIDPTEAGCSGEYKNYVGSFVPLFQNGFNPGFEVDFIVNSGYILLISTDGSYVFGCVST